jgi:heptosyltransferase II
MAAYWVAAGVIRLVRALPLGVCFVLGRAVGTVCWVFLARYRRLAFDNILRAFGGEMTRRGARALVREHFATLGANLLCAFKIPALSQEDISRIAPIEGLDHIRRCVRGGRGVVLAINHIGNWELYAQLVFQVPEARFGTVYQALRNARIDRLVNRDRRRLGVLTFERRRGFQGALALLREPGVLGVLVDQNAATGGMWTPFFGRLSSTSTLAATLAARTGAAIIPVAITSAGFARWKVTVGEELPAANAGIGEVTTRINRALEDQIRSSPRDWLWVHNRWRIPHPRFLTVTQKRGTFVPPGCPPLQPFRLLARSPNWLGDAVMSIPAVRAFKTGRPDARLTVLAPAKLVPLWESVPDVDAVVSIAPGESVWAVARRLRGRFEAAVLFPNSLRAALEVWLAGIPRRVGLRGHFRSSLLNQIIKEKQRVRVPRPVHHADRYAHIALRCGGEIPPPHPPAWSPPREVVIAVCPGAEFGPAKRWPAGNFRAVMDDLDARISCRWVVFGTASDAPVAAEILSGFAGRAENLCGKTDLAGLIRGLAASSALLTNDTGTMHLADHLGVPLVAVFGSTEPLLTGPRRPSSTTLRHQVECSPCFLRTCPLDFRCMKAVTPPDAATALLGLLQRTGAANIPRPDSPSARKPSS